MTEQRAKYETDTSVATRLPDEFEQRLDALIDDPITPRWRAVAMICADAIKKIGGRSKMLVYQRCADKFNLGVSTVRLWQKYHVELGDFLDEMPFTPEWTLIRLAYRESWKRNMWVEDILTERYTEADKHGGQLCPYRVWASQLKDAPEKPDPVIAKLERLSNCAATALKAVISGAYSQFAERLDKLATEADAILTEVEKLKG